MNDASDNWFQKHHSALISYSHEDITDLTICEKLVAETFVLAQKSPACFSNENAQRKWLVAILKNKIHDFISKNPSTDLNTGSK